MFRFFSFIYHDHQRAVIVGFSEKTVLNEECSFGSSHWNQNLIAIMVVQQTNEQANKQPKLAPNKRKYEQWARKREPTLGAQLATCDLHDSQITVLSLIY